MEFLEHLGEGLHAHVMKVKISGYIYALKVVSTALSTLLACKFFDEAA